MANDRKKKMTIKSLEGQMEELKRQMNSIEKNVKTLSFGGNFLTLLTLVFILAKLTGHFNYSWWVVFSPMWLPWVILIMLVIGILTIGGVVRLVNHFFWK